MNPRPLITLLAIISLSVSSGSVRAEPALQPQELAPGVHVLSSDWDFGSANIGWLELENSVLMIDAGHPDHLPKVLGMIEKTAGKPVREVILTHARPDQIKSALTLAAKGVTLIAHPEAAPALNSTENSIRLIREVVSIERDGYDIELRPYGYAAGPGNLTVHLKRRGILFAGELVRTQTINPGFPRGRTEIWIAALKKLARETASKVVPGFGTPGNRNLVSRQLRYVVELRRQVCYLVSQMKPLEFVTDEILRLGMPGPLLNWKPYDDPKKEDVEHLYKELTVPAAPFGVRPFSDNDKRPKALCIIGDRVHYPAHTEEGLARAFDLAGVDARIAFDPRALSAKNLAQVQLFVILRDGTIWPENMKDQAHWLQEEQVNALRDFISAGGGFLALHNSTALWRDDYVELLGGKYDGHGPLERFRVRVTDREHPITQGITDFEVADEQHWPIVDRARVHIFLENVKEDGKIGAAGFEHQLGKGRICYLANGHTRESMEHPMVQKLMANGMRWCLRRLPE